MRLIKPLPEGSKHPDPRTNLDPKRELMFNPKYHVKVAREPLKEEWDSVGSWVIGPQKDPKCYQSKVPPPPEKPYPHLLFWMEDDTGCDVCTIMDSDLLTLQHAAEGKDVGRRYRPHNTGSDTGLGVPGGPETARENARAIALGRSGGIPAPKRYRTPSSSAATGEAGLGGLASYAIGRALAKGPKGAGGEAAKRPENPTDPETEPLDETQLNAEMVPLLGYISFVDSSGHIAYQPCVALEINLFAGGSTRMLKEWEIIEVAVAPDTTYPARPIRLLGPWLRHRFYTVTAPDGTGRMWILKKWWRTGLQIPMVRVGDSGTMPGIKITKPEETAQKLPEYRVYESPPRRENDFEPHTFSWNRYRGKGGAGMLGK